MKRKIFQVDKKISLIEAINIAEERAKSTGLILTYCHRQEDLPSKAFFDLYYYFILMDREAFENRVQHSS